MIAGAIGGGFALLLELQGAQRLFLPLLLLPPFDRISFVFRCPALPPSLPLLLLHLLLRIRISGYVSHPLTSIKPLALRLSRAFFCLLDYVLPLSNIPKQSRCVPEVWWGQCLRPEILSGAHEVF